MNPQQQGAIRKFNPPLGVVPMDEKLERALYALGDVPSNTASAMTVEQWRSAWVEEWQRANRAEVALEELILENERRDSQMKRGTE